MKKKILICLSCILLASSVFAGCGNRSSKTDVSDNSDTALQEQTEIKSEDYSDGFDWEIVKQDITLDGKKIDVPFSVNDLGEGYKMGAISDDYLGENSCHGLLKKSDENGSSSWVCTLYFDGLKSDEYNDDIKCTRITVADTLTVQGIGEGSSLKDAEKLFGTPYEKTDLFAFYLSKSGTERIEIRYDSETKKVERVEITLNFQEEK